MQGASRAAHHQTTKSPGRRRGFELLNLIRLGRSVSGDHRAAEAIADTRTHGVEHRIMFVREAGERDSRVVPEGAEIGVAILKTSRPVGCEAVFPARADGPAGAGGRDGLKQSVRKHVGVVHIRPGRTAGHVEQRIVESYTEATADRGLSVDPEVRAVEVCQAITALYVRAFKVAFETEHKLANLPIVANVTTAHEAIGVEALDEARGDARRGDELTAAVITPGVADLRTDVEAGPVVKRGYRRGCLGVRPGGQIGC